MKIIRSGFSLSSPEGVTDKYTVRLTLPQFLREGQYSFQLGLLSVDEPDFAHVISEPVQLNLRQRQPLSGRVFAIWAMIITALLLTAIVVSVLLLRPRPSIEVLLDAPDEMIAGQTAVYSVTVQNSQQVSLTHTAVSFYPPASLLGATAYIIDESFRHCDESEQEIICNLDLLLPDSAQTIRIEVYPRPGALAIDNTNLISVTAELNGVPLARPEGASLQTGGLTTQILPAPAGAHLVVDRTVGTATVGEPLTFQLYAWHQEEITSTRQLSVSYTLPDGLRYQQRDWPDLTDSSHCEPQGDDYFTLVCDLGATTTGQIAAANFAVVPNETVASTLDNQFDLRVDSPIVSPTVAAAANMTITQTQQALLEINPPLEISQTVLCQWPTASWFLTARGQWAELGYDGMPGSFTVEMWVNPFSTENGQGLIGAHTVAGDNIFLIGYYSDGIDVLLGNSEQEERYTLPLSQREISTTSALDRYHLTVSVNRQSDSRSEVALYINGVLQRGWLVTDEERVCGCKIYSTAIAAGTEIMSWSVGQDWDEGNPARLSDFFHGGLSDVRLWDGALTVNQIQQFWQRRALPTDVWIGRADGIPPLIGYWRLAPLAGADASFSLPDEGIASYQGERYGATWLDLGPNYQQALAFDGVNDGLAAPDFTISTSQAGDTIQISLSSWILIDSIPTDEQWVVGYAPLEDEGTIVVDGEEPAGDALATEIAALETSLQTLTETMRTADTEAAQLQASVDTNLAAQRTAQDELIAQLMSYLGLNPTEIRIMTATRSL